MIDPVSAGMAGAGLLSGFLGGGNEMELPPEVQRILKMLLQTAKQARRYGAGVPGSDPQEQAALAQAKALAGEDIGNSRDRLLAGLGLNAPSASDALGRFDSSAADTFSGMDLTALLDSLGRRQQAKFGTVPSILGQAGGLASGQRYSSGQDLTGLLSSIAGQYAQSRYKPPQYSINSINYGQGGGANGSDPSRGDSWM